MVLLITTTLGIDITTGEEVHLPPDNLHTYIIGNTGTGKTTLERSLIAESINAGHGVCVIDPHGERDGSLVDLVLGDLPKKRLSDVILFDVNDPRFVPGLKPFHCRDKDDPIAVQDTISTALNMFEKVYNVDRNTMARIIAYIESLIYLFIYDESLTLLDIPTLLNPDIKYDKKRLLAVTHLPTSPGFHFTRDFWTEEYSRRAKRGYNQDSEIFGTLMKFRELSSHLLWPMFCQNKNTLDLREIMQKKKILLVKLNGNWEDITSLLGTYLIGQIKAASFHRSLSDPPFYLYVDEFQRMASRDFLTLFSEARGGNVHVCIDHQVASQLDDDMKETIRQASTFVCFQVTDITASAISRIFDTTPPPGEWIYEKIMRKAQSITSVEVWDSPDKEAEYLALEALIEQKKNEPIPTGTRKLMPVSVSAFPIIMTPNLREVAERLQGLLRPFIYDPEVEAYFKDMYEIRSSFGFTYSHPKYMGKRQLSYYRDFSGEYHKVERHFTGKKLPPFTYYAIKPHIKANTRYQFPLHFPCAFEEEALYDPEIVEELKTLYAPMKQRAYYLFDVGEYERYLSQVYSAAGTSIEVLTNPWTGPYLSDHDLLTLLKLIYQRTVPYISHEDIRYGEILELERRQRSLEINHFRTETFMEELGWYEPEPIFELEYIRAEREWGRIIGHEFMVGDNYKYRARLGPPPYGSDEVANRTANQIKQLDKFTARVRIPSGEYTITTIAPQKNMDINTLNKRIAQIYQQNLTDGFLRLRSDVEKELLTQPSYQAPQISQHPVPAIPLPAKRRK
jgi:hypothetical protein